MTLTGEQERQRHEWYFFILNTRAEAGKIQERILQYFAPCNEFFEMKSGRLISRNYLEGRLIQFRSDIGKIETKKIYLGRFLLDRNLKQMDDVKFSNYLQKVSFS